MLLFPTGLIIRKTERLALLHVVPDPEAWIRDAILEKARTRKEAIINEWRPILFADPAVTSLPAGTDDLVELIMARSDYKTRVQSDAERSVTPAKYNIERFGTRSTSSTTVVLVPSGIDIPDVDANCILAYVQDLGDWVLGALLGHINRGKKKLIRQYEPILRADPKVSTMPATEDNLIQTIIARKDYKTLPAQAAEARS